MSTLNVCIELAKPAPLKGRAVRGIVTDWFAADRPEGAPDYGGARHVILPWPDSEAWPAVGTLVNVRRDKYGMLRVYVPASYGSVTID